MFSAMSLLSEIETAADSLSREEKRALLRFLAEHLRDDGVTLGAPPAFEGKTAHHTGDSRRDAAERACGTGKASAWLRSAKGTIRSVAVGSADDARMAYYAAKYGLNR